MRHVYLVYRRQLDGIGNKVLEVTSSWANVATIVFDIEQQEFQSAGVVDYGRVCEVLENLRERDKYSPITRDVIWDDEIWVEIATGDVDADLSFAQLMKQVSCLSELYTPRE